MSATKAVCSVRAAVYTLETDGVPVAMALAFSNGTWGLFDLEERRLFAATWTSPAGVAKGWDAIQAKALEPDRYTLLRASLDKFGRALRTVESHDNYTEYNQGWRDANAAAADGIEEMLREGREVPS